MPGTSTSEQGYQNVDICAGYNAGATDTLAGQPVAHYPFETLPHDHKFWVGVAGYGLRFFGVTRMAIESLRDGGAIQRRGRIYARVKAAATALPGAYLAPEWGSTGHFRVCSHPTPFRLVTNLSGQTVGTIYGPDNPASISSVETVPEIIIQEYDPKQLVWESPATASTTGVHAAVTDDGTEQTITTAITNPDVPRNITATSGGTATDIKAVQVVITGTNYLDEVITETLPVFTENTATTVVGSLAFKTVTSIVIPAHDGNAATTAIGFGDKLGFPDAAAQRRAESAWLGGTKEGTAATLVGDADEIEKNTIDLNSALNNTEVAVRLYE